MAVSTFTSCEWCHSDVFMVNFESISHLALVYLFLNFNKQILAEKNIYDAKVYLKDLYIFHEFVPYT